MKIRWGLLARLETKVVGDAFFISSVQLKFFKGATYGADWHFSVFCDGSSHL